MAATNRDEAENVKKSALGSKLKELAEAAARRRPTPGGELPAVFINRTHLELHGDGLARLSLGEEIGDSGLVSWHVAVIMPEGIALVIAQGLAEGIAKIRAAQA